MSRFTQYDWRLWLTPGFRKNIVYCGSLTIGHPAKIRNYLVLPFRVFLAGKRHFLRCGLMFWFLYCETMLTRSLSAWCGPWSCRFTEAIERPSTVYAKQHRSSCWTPRCNHPSTKCIESIPYGRRLNLRYEVAMHYNHYLQSIQGPGLITFLASHVWYIYLTHGV